MTAEMASNQMSKRLTTKVAVLAIVVSLTSLLLCQGAANASGGLKSGNKVTVWMKPDANARDIHAVGARLARLSYLRQPCVYWNKARNFAEARKLLPFDIWHNATVADMPTSYRCTPVVLADANQVIRSMKGAPGALTVTVG